MNKFVEDMKNGFGCIGFCMIVFGVCVVGYFMLHIFLWLLPFLITISIIGFVIYIFCRGLQSVFKD